MLDLALMMRMFLHVLVLVLILKHALVLAHSHLLCLAESVGDVASGILSVVPVPKDAVRCVHSADECHAHQPRLMVLECQSDMPRTNYHELQ